MYINSVGIAMGRVTGSTEFVGKGHFCFPTSIYTIQYNTIHTIISRVVML